MAKAATATPPVDSNGEMQRAGTALRRCRSAIDKAELPEDWKRWVAQSLAASFLADDEKGTDQK